MEDDSASSSRCSTAGAIPEFTLRVRQTNGTIIEHPVSSRSLSVAELKQALSERTEIPVARMRLMLESTILADDQSLESYGKLVQLAGNHLQNHPRNVNGISSAAAPSPPSSTMAMTNQARQLFLANPQLAQTIMMANPQMREALDNNPQLRNLMNDPEVMQQSFDAVQNPQLMQEVQRNNDRVLSNLESTPGGYAHIRRMYHSIQEPLARAAEDSTRMPLDELNRRRARMLGVVKPDASRVNTTPLPNPWSKTRSRAGSRASPFDMRNPFSMTDQVSRNAERLARLDISAASQPPPSSARDPLGLSHLQSQLSRLGALSAAYPSPSTPPHQQPSSSGVQRSRSSSRTQPFAYQQHRNQQQPQQLPAQMSAMSMSNPAFPHSVDSGLSIAAAAPPALNNLSGVELSLHQERYRDELNQLEEMGFADKDKNLRALIVTEGDLSLALNIIADCDDE
ncbi:hypothetical protein GGH94_000385 [Coemansia aciculifera]|uniref:UBA domain-containing protein n=1 Tax=Coemansia aciculifera TaxID=417176 RepID=A0A9W8IW85_9FUNG|nr:hypothetical protein GGH94_000385 [Coemansia aciculifera]